MCHLFIAIRTNTTDEQTELRKNLTFSAVYHYLTAMANMNDHERPCPTSGVVQPRALRQAGLPVLCSADLTKQYPDHDVSDEKCIRDRCCD